MRYRELLSFLRQEYYREAGSVLQSADFLVLGDTIECWPVTSSQPYRLHYFGEELEKIELNQDGRWRPVTQFPNFRSNSIKTEQGTIHPGDYIVHPNHGVGIFERIVTKVDLEGETRSFVSLQYAANDRLLYPLEREQELMPYIGSRHPRLTRLYSRSWANTKERVAKNLIHIARELLKIYAARTLTERPPYQLAPSWQQQLEQSVDFQLTEDQARSLQEIQHDLGESTYPMDRLVCGDVGFGKTEVALRAAAQVLAAGKQVAFIAPTTILVEQHFALIQQRFADLPVKVAHLSRLTSGSDQETIKKIEAGTVDLVVGTHRLLGKDVQFRDLGLLILDEEQKFGVAQKEQLKKMRPSIDVLALSATPIPRTLSMSLSGLRGLSLLRTAPPGRKPVETEIHPYTDEIIQKAIVYELERGGQVYVVHNRVQSLPAVVKHITTLIERTSQSKARIAQAHGQMVETELARTMSDFVRGDIDVLVASSIIEHGLDSPTANTLIVLHSEWFGLSDLYQLRGRVGRRQKQAHAYFLLGGVERAVFDSSAEEEVFHLTETARKRLLALKEADELGSGWSIALRDMEIRGTGNILGHEQHGNMEAIGIVLYSQLLREAIGQEAKRLHIQLFQTTGRSE